MTILISLVLSKSFGSELNDDFFFIEGEAESADININIKYLFCSILVCRTTVLIMIVFD